MKNANAFRSLTTRQRQIAKLVARGFTNPEIGEKLGISPSTVGVHLNIVFWNLRIKRRAQLARIVPRSGRASK